MCGLLLKIFLMIRVDFGVAAVSGIFAPGNTEYEPCPGKINVHT
jgi:hypothetical protein